MEKDLGAITYHPTWPTPPDKKGKGWWSISDGDKGLSWRPIGIGVVDQI